MKTVVVAGAVGVIGRAVLAHYERVPEVRLVGLSRHAPDFPTRAEHIAVDLSDAASCAQRLGGLADATHLVYAAYQERPTLSGLVAPNLGMLRNVVDALEAAAPRLEHISLMQGGKAYGCHLGPFVTPARETDARHLPPNFYFDQEDLLRSRAQGARWSWTAFRPEAVCGLAVGNPMNLLMVIAVYATLCKALGAPLEFPGSAASYDALYQVTDGRILARAVEWAGETPSCRGEAFNITNGDYFRWSGMWPRIAASFDMVPGPPRPISLVDTMADKGPLWDEIVRRHGLRPYRYEQIVSWAFGDAILKTPYDNITSTIKARRHGFADCIDTADMFVELLAELRDFGVIPRG